MIAYDAQLMDKLVLVVEDDPDLCQVIYWMLADEGFTVETASDGREALKQAEQKKPALVILDIGLPIIDGYGVAAGLHATYGDAISILTMTAGGQAEEKARQMGAIGFLNKPFEMDALLNAVRSALQQA